MSQYVPDWNVEDESRFFRDLLPITNQKLSTGAEDELVELLWQNGHVVMHSQSQRKSPTTFSEFKQVQKPEQVQRSEQSMGNPSNVIQDDDTASWFQYPVDDSLDKEFCSEFFFEMAGADGFGSDRISKDVIEDQERYVKFGACNDNNLGMSSVPGHCIVSEKISPPNPRSSILGSSLEASCLENDGVVNFSHFTRSAKVDLESSNCQFNVGSGSGIKLRVQEPSMMTIGSSNCGSNQIPSRIDRSHAMSSDTTGGGAGLSEEDGRIKLPTDIEMTNAHETTTTSSGGSGCSIGRSMRQRKSNQSQKRKGRDVEDFECQSEDNDHGKRITKKPAQKSTSTRRSRAAEVHNLSERRRRDRINEKMKALQELIPHCNKADKASMLDEAIEYLKTLQLQVQMMWMGGGMAAPMMFPGMQQYISAMGMGMAPASLPSMASAVQMPRVPFINQTMTTAHARNQAPMYPSLSMPPVNFSNSMQGIHQPEPYAFLGFPHLQPQTQQNQPAVASHTGSLPNAGERAPTKGEKRSGKINFVPCNNYKFD